MKRSRSLSGIIALSLLLFLLPQTRAARRGQTVKRVNAGNKKLATVSYVTTYRLNPKFVVEKYRFSNGLSVLILEDHSVPVFAYHTWFKVGSRHEKKGRTGIAHLFEHLLFKATKNLKDGEFDRIMEKNGSVTNAATWLDWTFYLQNLPRGKLSLVTRLEADRMENMILNAKQLNSEREVVKNERRLRVDNSPDGKLSELLYATAYTVHHYGWPTIGWMADINAITLADCLTFYKTYYSPNNATIIVVGDVKTERALTLIRKRYGHLKAQKIPKEEKLVEPAQKRERRKSVRLSISAPKMVAGYHSPALTDADHPTLMVLNEVLFGGKSGRLRKLLVTDNELLRQTSGWVSPFTYPGLYEIWLHLKKGQKPDTIEKLLDGELARLKKSGVTDRELLKAKNRLEIAFLRGLSTVGSIARQLGHYETTTGDFKNLFNVVKKYRAVTRSDVVKLARKIFRRSNRTLITALPLAGSKKK